MRYREIKALLLDGAGVAHFDGSGTQLRLAGLAGVGWWHEQVKG